MAWFPKKKVIVPVDFSDDSFAAVDTALDLVDDPAHVTVVHVLQDVAAAELSEAWHEADPNVRIRHASKLIRERLTGPRYESLAMDVVFGDPGHEIAELAEREDAELIVLPSHGRTGIQRLLIGSVAERVVRLAHCPVLVLRS